MKLTFLGTGTSTGVPQLMCVCPVCHSSDPHDRRMRCSAVVETGTETILIDCGPDFYFQMLQHHHNRPLDALIVTHSHYDHVGGVDDLRPYCTPEGFPVYCRADVAEDLRNRVPYCFRANPYPGVPHFAMHEIEPFRPFMIGHTEILPIEIMHARLPILGFRIGKNLAYITDAKTIPQETIDTIRGIDTLVINALRPTEHHSHMNIREALSVIEKVRPRVAWLIHLSCAFGFHADSQKLLPDNVHVAYDGLTIDIKD